MGRKRKTTEPARRPPPELRAGQRFTLLLRVAKLVSEQGEFLCVVRDVSDGGLKVRLFHPLEVDERCEIELGSGDRYPLERVWQRDGHAGFRFAGGPVEIHQLIEEAGPFPKRHIRLRIDPPVPLLVFAEGLTLPGRLCDISQHGAAIALDQRLALGLQVRIDALELPALHARVRWRRGGLHGLVFQEGFRLDALAELAGRIQLARHDAHETAKNPAALTID